MITAENATETEHGKFAIEASDLRALDLNFNLILPLSSWPATIATTLGNGRPFLLAGFDKVEDEIVAAGYRQELGCITLLVFND